MGRNCTVCIHAANSNIDAALGAGQPLREIAATYGISKTALHRHWHAHVVGESSTAARNTGVASNTGTPTNIGHGSRASTIAKWVLVAGLGLGVLVWVSAPYRDAKRIV